MNKKLFIKAILDGLIQSLILVCSGAFLVSTYASSLFLGQYLLIGLFGAILSAGVYAIFMVKESNNKAIMCFSLINMLCFIICMIIVLVIRLTFAFNFWPLRAVNNADGILLLFFVGCFILASIILRVCIFVVLVIKNVHKERQR